MGEKKMLTNAKNILISEMVIVKTPIPMRLIKNWATIVST